MGDSPLASSSTSAARIFFLRCSILLVKRSIRRFFPCTKLIPDDDELDELVGISEADELEEGIDWVLELNVNEPEEKELKSEEDDFEATESNLEKAERDERSSELGADRLEGRMVSTSEEELPEVLSEIVIVEVEVAEVSDERLSQVDKELIDSFEEASCVDWFGFVCPDMPFRFLAWVIVDWK